MKKLVTALAALAVLSLAPGVRAQSQKDSMDPSSGSQGTGGTGSTDTQGSTGSMGGGSAGSTGSMGGSAGGSMGSMGAMGEQSMEGRVLKADKTTITIEHNGAAIPLWVSSSTSFQGVKSVKEIKEGQQVRASFDLKKDKNELKSVEVLGGTGGAGDLGTPSTKEKAKPKSGGTY